jgi:hypothetical protein
LTRPPKWLWLLAAAIALLRALPFAATFVLPEPEQLAFVHVGYMPEDMHAYLSFIRQADVEGSFFLENRFVTAEQSGRFILLLHWLLGKVSAVTGIGPEWTLELSRIPLVFLFFGTVWWFLEPLFRGPDGARQRRWAVVLIAASGGVQGLLRPLAERLPEAVGRPFLRDTWHLNGWNTFEGLYNPLWIGGLILTLLLLRPALERFAPGRAPRRSPAVERLLRVVRALGLVVLFFVHPYSALVVLGITAALPLVSFIVDGNFERHRAVGEMMIALAAAVAIALVSAWQRLDPVFASSSEKFFGIFLLPVLWYPVTFGVLLALALRGATNWIESRHPFRAPIIAWVAVVVMLHTSSWINGYHFILYLHLPLAILAGSVAPRAWDELVRRGVGARLVLAVLTVLLFVNPLLVTAESLSELRERNLVPRAFLEASAQLGQLPPGRVLAPPQMGLHVAARTSHSVWAGHWFLTPDYWRRVERYALLVADPAGPAELARLVAEERIDYVVVPQEAAERLAGALADRLRERQALAGLELLVIDR